MEELRQANAALQPQLNLFHSRCLLQQQCLKFAHGRCVLIVHGS